MASYFRTKILSLSIQVLNIRINFQEKSVFFHLHTFYCWINSDTFISRYEKKNGFEMSKKFVFRHSFNTNELNHSIVWPKYAMNMLCFCRKKANFPTIRKCQTINSIRLPSSVDSFTWDLFLENTFWVYYNEHRVLRATHKDIEAAIQRGEANCFRLTNKNPIWTREEEKTTTSTSN